jgi:hypothetical protein
VPEIMKATPHSGILPQLMPPPTEINRVAAGITRKRLAPREEVVLGFRLAEMLNEPPPIDTAS